MKMSRYLNSRLNCFHQKSIHFNPFSSIIKQMIRGFLWMENLQAVQRNLDLMDYFKAPVFEKVFFEVRLLER